MKHNDFDLIVVGAGPIGLLSALEGAKRGQKVAVFESQAVAGGQLIELYPKKEIVDLPNIDMIIAEDYIKLLIEKINAYRDSITIFYNKPVIFIDEEDGQPFVMSKERRYLARNVIIATGLGVYQPRKMGVPGEIDFPQVLYSIKDYNFLAGKRVAIMGGGDSAIDWAKMTAKVGKSVALVHRRNEFRGEIETIDGIDNIKKLTPYIPVQLEGVDGVLKTITLRNVGTNETLVLDVDYVFVNYGNIPTSDFFGFEKLGMGIKVDEHLRVKPHIYVVGDVAGYQDKRKRIEPAMREIETVFAGLN